MRGSKPDIQTQSLFASNIYAQGRAGTFEVRQGGLCSVIANQILNRKGTWYQYQH